MRAHKRNPWRGGWGYDKRQARRARRRSAAIEAVLAAELREIAARVR